MLYLKGSLSELLTRVEKAVQV